MIWGISASRRGFSALPPLTTESQKLPRIGVERG